MDQLQDLSPGKPLEAVVEGQDAATTEGTASGIGNLRPLSDLTFDPLVVQISRKPKGFGGGNGFVTWPERPEDRKGLRVMILGNSASIWPMHRWSLEAAEILEGQGTPLTLYNGAVRGHTSAQELLRVVRDMPAMRPDAVVAMSGICDAGSIVSEPGFPFTHVYTKRIERAVLATKVALRMSKGARDDRPWSEIWLQNHRFASLICEEMGVSYTVFLQPLLGVGSYVPSPREAAILEGKRAALLHSGVRYLPAMRAFYEEVQGRLRAEPERHKHVADISECLVGVTEAFGDHRHPSRFGEPVIGRAVAEVLGPKLSPLARSAAGLSS